MRQSSHLSFATLASLRQHLANLTSSRGTTFGTTGIVQLANDLRDAAPVTIDFVASEFVGAPVVFVHERRPLPPCLASLSPREREVAMLIGEGRSNKEIAQDLGISLATVKDHVHHILEKTGLASRTAVVARLTRPSS
jgi:DNA-binding NarL/FixJ family response regulator